MSEVQLKVPAVYLPLGNLKINGIQLRKFQEDLFYELDNSRKILLEAPTGSGKTFSIIVLLSKLVFQGSKLPIIGIYPSRVLVYDQKKSIINTLKDMGFKEEKEDYYFTGQSRISNLQNCGKYMVKGEDNTCEKNISLVLVDLTSETNKKAYDILQNLKASDYLIMLTVPEYPYMYISHIGKVEDFSRVIEAVAKGKVNNLQIRKSNIEHIFNEFTKYFNGYFFIDEYHLYTGLARASLYTLIRMIDDFNSSQPIHKFVFSSATPLSGIHVDKVIRAQTFPNGSKIRKDTTLIFHLTNKTNAQEALVDYVTSLQTNGRRSNSNNNRKVGIIVDRVYYISKICEKIQAAVVWGLDRDYGLCRKSSDIKNEKVIVGNSAISFGIDIPDLDEGYIHSHDAETAIQRIGRFGRHGEGSAEIHIFTTAKYSVVNFLNSVKDKPLSLFEYVDVIRKVFKSREDDKLDQIPLSKERSEIIYKTYEYLKLISQSSEMLQIKGYTPPQVSGLIKLRPSAEDYFKVFAYRPGRIVGKWCNGNEDDLFTLIRNFEYDKNNGCFKETPSRQNPEVYLENIPQNKFYSFLEFDQISKPLININGLTLRLNVIKGLEDSYVLIITEDDMKGLWDDFYEMARLVASYASAFVSCYKKNRRINNRQEYECDSVDALLLFI
ncbi:DEAD/DEAH box helicase [Sulfolobus sp. E5-1-F]|uniref:DEAD/DEAH box helicase n=1 Tax=Saccharolobus sp. E5-1-F TaxID=2663019 RepID=UPI001297764F|nr:DEAD/DEAH box helicase [Sulfolobus sp. E5-1-F]QGA53944.1 DEAD/DEAH box helicase [Sulfolobus sp. E5-1-F]